MNVVYVPLNWLRREQWGMCEAITRMRNGIVFDFMKYLYQGKTRNQAGDLFIECVRAHQPDLVHLHVGYSGLFDDSWIDSARSVSPKTVFTDWFGDWREETSKGMRRRIQKCNALLVSNDDPKNHALFLGTGARAVLYLQTAVARYTPIPRDKRYKVIFCNNHRDSGTFPWTDQRNLLFSELRKKYGEDAGLYGGNWHMENVRASRYHDQLDLFASASVVLSFNNMTVPHCHSTRFMYALYSGACTVSDRFPGCEDFARDGLEALYFDPGSIGDCMEKIDWAIAHPDAAQEIGRRGREAVERAHLWDHRVQTLTGSIFNQLRSV